MSFTFCSMNRNTPGGYIYGEDEALELAEKAHGFFLLSGHNISAENGDIVIQNVGAVANRSELLVTDTVRRYGFDTQTKDMPYGIYTVKQTSGWEGRELMKPFDVFINKDGNTYRYLINNANFESYIKVVKKDAETGNTIPYAGVGFQIYDPNGGLVTMTFTYPEVTTIDTFYTTADGDLITPQTLEYGTGYSLVEVQAPYGYVLNSEPVYFDVVQENSEEESGITVIEVVRSNTAQKGTITVGKSGEVFSTVSGTKGLYQPIFSVAGLEGAVYEITAAEDIYTLDGTLRASKGEVVDIVTTGADGTAKSKELYLGKYEVKEVTAPFGFVLNSEVHAVELVYAGQEIAVTETATDFYNERQRVEIDLAKSLETDEAYGVGTNGEIRDAESGVELHEEYLYGVNLRVGEILIGPEKVLEKRDVLGEPRHPLECVGRSCVYLAGTIRPGFRLQGVDGVLAGHKIDIAAAQSIGEFLIFGFRVQADAGLARLPEIC